MIECPANSELAGRASVCDGCPGQQFCQAQSGDDPEQEDLDLRMGAIKHKILVLSGKGGVGKSTCAMFLARALDREGKKVGIVDLDICGPSIPKMAAVENQSIVNTEYGWKPLQPPNSSMKIMSVGSMLPSDGTSVVFRGPRKTGLIRRFLKDTFWGRLDFLICDTPPGTSDEHLAVVKNLKNVKPDGAIIVTTPQDVAIATIKREINFCQKMGIRILGFIGNMQTYACPCCGEVNALFDGGGLSRLSENTNIPLLGNLPLEEKIAKCCESGFDPFLLHQDSPVVQEMQKVTRTLLNIIDSK